MNTKKMFITVYPGGFGKAIAEAALKRGDYVIAATLDSSLLEELVDQFDRSLFILPLTSADYKEGAVAIAELQTVLGRIDTVIDAGFNLSPALSVSTAINHHELSISAHLGIPWLSAALFPILKNQHGGHYFQLSASSQVIFPILYNFPLCNGERSWNLKKITDEMDRSDVRVSFIEPIIDQRDFFELRTSERHVSYQRIGINSTATAWSADALLRIADLTHSHVA